MTYRICSRCEDDKPLDDFPRRRRAHDGRHEYCRRCVKVLWRFRRYGLTESDYEDLLERQNHRCPPCSSTLNDDRFTHVDHCHTTGRIRGLLCHRCNTALGLVKEDASRLRGLLTYLEER